MRRFCLVMLLSSACSLNLPREDERTYSCNSGSDCASGYSCISNTCQKPGSSQGRVCKSYTDCQVPASFCDGTGHCIDACSKSPCGNGLMCRELQSPSGYECYGQSKCQSCATDQACIATSGGGGVCMSKCNSACSPPSSACYDVQGADGGSVSVCVTCGGCGAGQRCTVSGSTFDSLQKSCQCNSADCTTALGGGGRCVTNVCTADCDPADTANPCPDGSRCDVRDPKGVCRTDCQNDGYCGPNESCRLIVTGDGPTTQCIPAPCGTGCPDGKCLFTPFMQTGTCLGSGLCVSDAGCGSSELCAWTGDVDGRGACRTRCTATAGCLAGDVCSPALGLAGSSAGANLGACAPMPTCNGGCPMSFYFCQYADAALGSTTCVNDSCRSNIDCNSFGTSPYYVCVVDGRFPSGYSPWGVCRRPTVTGCTECSEMCDANANLVGGGTQQVCRPWSDGSATAAWTCNGSACPGNPADFTCVLDPTSISNACRPRCDPITTACPAGETCIEALGYDFGIGRYNQMQPVCVSESMTQRYRQAMMQSSTWFSDPTAFNSVRRSQSTYVGSLVPSNIEASPMSAILQNSAPDQFTLLGASGQVQCAQPGRAHLARSTGVAGTSRLVVECLGSSSDGSWCHEVSSPGRPFVLLRSNSMPNCAYDQLWPDIPIVDVNGSVMRGALTDDVLAVVVQEGTTLMVRLAKMSYQMDAAGKTTGEPLWWPQTWILAPNRTLDRLELVLTNELVGVLSHTVDGKSFVEFAPVNDFRLGAPPRVRQLASTSGQEALSDLVADAHWVAWTHGLAGTAYVVEYVAAPVGDPQNGASQVGTITIGLVSNSLVRPRATLQNGYLAYNDANDYLPTKRIGLRELISSYGDRYFSVANYSYGQPVLLQVSMFTSAMLWAYEPQTSSVQELCFGENC
jgi:hypothetical protein